MRAVYTLALLLIVSSAASAGIDRRENRREFHARHQPLDCGLRFASCRQRYVRSQVERTCCAARRRGRQKAFAAQMIAAHTKTTEELKALVASGKVKETPPAQMDKSHLDKLSALAKLEGAKFTDQYQSDQVTAHKDAVSLFERYSQGGDNMDLKAWTLKTLPELKHHLEMAQKLAE